MHPHLPADVREHFVPVVELHAEHRVGQRLGDRALELDRAVLLAHILRFHQVRRLLLSQHRPRRNAPKTRKTEDLPADERGSPTSAC